MSFNFQADPDLQLARAQATSGRDRALAQIQEARRQALVNFGSADVARGVLGANDPTLAAISADPDRSNSVLAQIARGNRQAVDQAEAGYSSGSNLFYSGARAKGLTDLASDKVRQESEAQQQLQAALSGFNTQQAGAEEEYRNAIQGAQTGAYQRALDEALQYGIGPAPPPEPPPGPTPHLPPAASPMLPKANPHAAKKKKARATGLGKVAARYRQQQRARRERMKQGRH